MLRDFLTDKWVLGGVGFLIVFAVLCHACYKYDMASFQEQLPVADDNNSQENKSQKAQKDVPPTEPLEPVTDTPVPTQETTEKIDTFAKNIDSAANPHTFPFGFGPYPAVPEDYPNRKAVQAWVSVTAEHELLDRVRIKLWKQGIKTEGAMFDSNGLIYPNIPGVVYVKWYYVTEGPREYVGRRYAEQLFGNTEAMEKWESLYLTERGYERTDIDYTPEAFGIKVYEYPDGGIAPYNFLDLPR